MSVTSPMPDASTLGPRSVCTMTRSWLATTTAPLRPVTASAATPSIGLSPGASSTSTRPSRATCQRTTSPCSDDAATTVPPPPMAIELGIHGSSAAATASPLSGSTTTRRSSAAATTARPPASTATCWYGPSGMLAARPPPSGDPITTRPSWMRATTAPPAATVPSGTALDSSTASSLSDTTVHHGPTPKPSTIIRSPSLPTVARNGSSRQPGTADSATGCSLDDVHRRTTQVASIVKTSPSSAKATTCAYGIGGCSVRAPVTVSTTRNVS